MRMKFEAGQGNVKNFISYVNYFLTKLLIFFPMK